MLTTLFLLIVLLNAFVIAQEPEPEPEPECEDVSEDDYSLEAIQNEFRILSNFNQTVLEDMALYTSKRYDEEFEGLSVQEASLKFPPLYVQLLIEVIGVFQEEGDIYGPAVTVKGLLEAQNGTEILVEIFTNPEFFSDAIVQLVDLGNVLNCYEDQGYAITSVIAILTVPFFQTPFQDLFAYFLVGLTINIGETYGVGDQIIQVLQPMVELLEQSADAQGVLSALFSLGSSEIVANAFEEVMSGLDFATNATAWAGLMSGYFQQVEQALDVEDADFVNLLANSFQEIIQTLQ